MDDVAFRCRDFPGDFEAGEVLVAVFLAGERDVLRFDLDRIVHEPGVRIRAGKHPGDPRTRHEVEQIVALDEPSPRFRSRHPAGVQPAVRRPVDVLEERLRLEDLHVRLQQARRHAPVGPHRDGRVGELGRDLLQEFVGLQPRVVRLERLGRHQFFGLVDDVVELDEGAGVVLPEEQHVEGWEQEVFLRQVEPEFGRVEPRDGGERLALVRLPELDVDPPPVRQPAGNRALPPENGVRVLDALVVLDAELVLRGQRLGVAPRPEGGDERLAFGLRLEPFESVFLPVADDVDDLVLEPLLVLVRKRKAVLGGGEAGDGQDECREQSGERTRRRGGDNAHGIPFILTRNDRGCIRRADRRGPPSAW